MSHTAGDDATDRNATNRRATVRHISWSDAWAVANGHHYAWLGVIQGV